jgi:hypothetical protein
VWQLLLVGWTACWWLVEERAGQAATNNIYRGPPW